MTNAKDATNTIVEISVNIYSCDKDAAGIKNVPSTVNKIPEDNISFEELSNHEEAQSSGLVEKVAGGYFGGLLAHALAPSSVNSETPASTADGDIALPDLLAIPLMAGGETSTATSSYDDILSLSAFPGFDAINSDLDPISASNINNPNHLSFQELQYSANYEDPENHNGSVET